MTHAQSDTGSDGVANRPPAASTIERELAVEQAHVDLVYARLAEATRSAQQVARAGRSLYQSDRTSFVREEDGTGLYERDVFAFQAARRLAVLDAEQEGLVFGRLDRTDGEIRYVGRIGVRDAEYEPLVIDWRAPAAEPFYRATPSNPMQVIRRRVLHCRGDRVVGIEDDLLDGESADGALPVIGEGALLAALTRARDHTMRDIVATIQAEQDEAIRAPYQGFTMISGGPGTGKTVVALHRAAYLLYSNRRRFESGGVLVVGPSRVFMNYIDRVLPSLGEDSVTLRSIGAVASDVVRITGDRADDPATAAIKGSLRMVRLLRRLVHEPPQEVPLELRITVQGDVLVVSADTLARIRSQVLAHHKLNTGREAAAKELLSALWRNSRWAEEVDRPIMIMNVRSSTSGSPTSPPSRCSSTRGGRHSAHRKHWPGWPTSSCCGESRGRSCPTRSASCSARAIETLRTGLPPTVHCWMSWCICSDLCPSQRSRCCPASPILTPRFRRSSPPPTCSPRRHRKPIRSSLPTRRTRTCSSTRRRMSARCSGGCCAGAAQAPAGPSSAILPRAPGPTAEEADRAIEEIIGTAPVRHFRMSTNYRSPSEVFDLAAKVVVDDFPDADLPAAVRSTGHQPGSWCRRTSPEDPTIPAAMINIVRSLLAEVEGTVGVICPPATKAELADRARAGPTGWHGAACGGHTAAVEGPGVRRRAGDHSR